VISVNIYLNYFFAVSVSLILMKLSTNDVTLLVGTDKYHIQLCHHLRGDKSVLNKYDRYVVVYLAILSHDMIDMFYVSSHLQ